MSLAPSPSSGRGEVVLQPAYFTSSAFVHAAREDIDRLLQEYSQRYACSRTRPFGLFKDVWWTQGWPWMQFKVFDARSRAAFLRVVMRLFLERIGGGEAPLSRAGALFGLYTMLSTQPSTPAPPLYSVMRVEVTCDLYEEMMTLPDALDGEFLLPVRPHVIYVQSRLLEAEAFLVLPRAETRPLSPCAVPREVVADEGVPTSTGQGRKGRGRPSRREKKREARESLVALDGWGGGVSPPSGTRGRYEGAKRALEDGAGGDAGWEAANAAVAERVSSLGGLFLG